MNIKNCRLKKTSLKDDARDRFYGFYLAARGQMIEFICVGTNQAAKTDQTRWIDALKHCVVLLSPAKELTFDKSKPIGVGASAQVHRATCKSDSSIQYAVKSIKKDFIMTDPYFIVSDLPVLTFCM